MALQFEAGHTMKLKRFLLRYDPPGVGFEVEEDGVTVVHHRDLRTAEEVHSPEEIRQLADELIAGEPAIKFKSKHRPALQQLLGRLYRMEVPEERLSSSLQTRMDNNITNNRNNNNQDCLQNQDLSSEDEARLSGLQKGQTVVLFRLQGNLQVHNCQTGVLIKASRDKSRYEVKMAGESRMRKTGDFGGTGNFGGTRTGDPQHGIVKLRTAENILPVAPNNALSIGAHALIRGLHNHHELNGNLCKVVQCFEEAQRYQVCEFKTGLYFRMKLENLIPLMQCNHVLRIAFQISPSTTPEPRDTGPLKPGTMVTIVGLKTATVFNGQRALVMDADPVNQRYLIKMEDGSQKTVKMGNVVAMTGK